MRLLIDSTTFVSSSRVDRECNYVEGVDDAVCDCGLANSDKDAAELICPLPISDFNQ